MNTSIKIFILTFFTTLAFAQEKEPAEQSQNPKGRERIQAARIAYITEELSLTPEEAEKFWPIYREFTEKRKQLQKQYREAKQNPDPTKTKEQHDKELIDLGLNLKQKEVDLEKEYSSRLLKVISAEKVNALPEAERKFRVMVLQQIERRHKHHNRKPNKGDHH